MNMVEAIQELIAILQAHPKAYSQSRSLLNAMLQGAELQEQVIYQLALRPTRTVQLNVMPAGKVDLSDA